MRSKLEYRTLSWMVAGLAICGLALAGCVPPAGETPIPTTAPAATAAPTATPRPTDTPAPTATATTAPTATPRPTDTPAPTQAPSTSARYRLTFVATWSAATHPTDYPPNPHFSGLIGAVHGPDARLWEVGQLASPGIKRMAELGAKSPLDDEANALIAAGTACAIVSGGGIGASPGQVSVTFTASPDCPLVSVVAMIAPSPDWFVGVSGLSLYENGEWVREKTVELFPYDAGTDDGVTYTSLNRVTDPPVPIYQIETDPFLVNGQVPPLGTFTFTRLDE